MGILSGALQGLGRGIASTGQIYNDAKQQAIERMFREQALALQQDAADRQQAEMEFNQAFNVIRQLPANTPLDLDAYGPGGRGVLEQFSRDVEVTHPGTRDATLPARSLDVPVMDAPPGMPGTPRQVGTIQGQDLTPPQRTTERRSIPTEDSRARTALVNQQAANSRAMMRMQTQMEIARMKNDLTRQIATETNEIRRKQLEVQLQRVQAYEQYVGNQAAYQGGMLDHYANQDELDAYIAEHGRPKTGGGEFDFMEQLRFQMMQRMMEQMGSGAAAPPAGGAAPPAPAQAPKAPPRPKPPQPRPRPSSGGGGGGDLYDRYKNRGKQ